MLQSFSARDCKVHWWWTIRVSCTVGSFIRIQSVSYVANASDAWNSGVGFGTVSLTVGKTMIPVAIASTTSLIVSATIEGSGICFMWLSQGCRCYCCLNVLKEIMSVFMKYCSLVGFSMHYWLDWVLLLADCFRNYFFLWSYLCFLRWVSTFSYLLAHLRTV